MGRGPQEPSESLPGGPRPTLLKLIALGFRGRKREIVKWRGLVPGLWRGLVPGLRKGIHLDRYGGWCVLETGGL